MELQPHQQRVVEEKAELDEKLDKLSEFIESSPVFKDLDHTERHRLLRQEGLMFGYSNVLGERIAAFRSAQDE